MKILCLIKNLLRFKSPYKLEIVKVTPQHEEIVPKQVEPIINVPTDERFEKLAEQVASLVKHYDAMADKLTDEAMKALLADMSNHLINTLVLGGCEPIADDTKFDVSRHIPTPFTLVEQGTPIQSIVRIGVKLNGKVLTPAKVRI
jgi:hypothetical protein